MPTQHDADDVMEELKQVRSQLAALQKSLGVLSPKGVAMLAGYSLLKKDLDEIKKVLVELKRSPR